MSDTFDLKVNGTEVQIKMSFGLLNVLCRAVGDVETAATINVDPVLRDVFISELLSKRDAKGKVVEKPDLEGLDVDVEKAIELVDWAGDHVLDFFLKGLEKTKAMQAKHMDRIKALMPTPTGSAS